MVMSYLFSRPLYVSLDKDESDVIEKTLKAQPLTAGTGKKGAGQKK